MGIEIFSIGTPQQVNDGSADYAELARGAAEDYSGENGFATRSFYVAYSFKDTFEDYLMGFSTGLDGNAITRTLPDEHPDYPSLWCTASTLEGKGKQDMGPNGAISYDFAEITATYRSLDYALIQDNQIDGDELNRYCTRGYVFSSEYLTNQGFLQWVSRDGVTPVTLNGVSTIPPKALAVNPGKIVCNCQKTITWHQVPADPDNMWDCPGITNIVSQIGTVNSDLFDGHPAGSVLFLGIDPKLTRPRVGSDNYYWEVAFQFKIMNNGNQLVMGVNGATASDTMDQCAGIQYIYDTLEGRWDLATSNGTVTGNRIYAYSDFNNLFLWDLS